MITPEVVDSLPERTRGSFAGLWMGIAKCAKENPGKWVRAAMEETTFKSASYYKSIGYECHIRTVEGVKYVYMRYILEVIE